MVTSLYSVSRFITKRRPGFITTQQGIPVVHYQAWPRNASLLPSIGRGLSPLGWKRRFITKRQPGTPVYHQEWAGVYHLSAGDTSLAPSITQECRFSTKHQSGTPVYHQMLAGVYHLSAENAGLSPSIGRGL